MILKELLDIFERRNHMGEVEFTSFSSWKTACKKVDPTVWWDGTVDICNAFVGAKPYKRGSSRAIGEWDGEKGVVFQGLKEDYGLWEITDTTDPHSEVYFSGTKQECEEWLTDNEHNDQFKNCEFDMSESE